MLTSPDSLHSQVFEQHEKDYVISLRIQPRMFDSTIKQLQRFSLVFDSDSEGINKRIIVGFRPANRDLFPQGTKVFLQSPATEESEKLFVEGITIGKLLEEINQTDYIAQLFSNTEYELIVTIAVHGGTIQENSEFEVETLES